jgi:hypothetical protein
VASNNIKKAVFPIVNLPAAILNTDETFTYYVRFRLTSDDKNRKSHWSPIFAVNLPEGSLILYQSIDGGDNIGS